MVPVCVHEYDRVWVVCDRFDAWNWKLSGLLPISGWFDGPMGLLLPHPARTSEEIAALAPDLEVQRDWRGPQYLEESIRRVRAFMERHTPKG